MKPRKNYRSRPKKTGAKKRQRVLSQKRRLIASGYDKDLLDKMTIVEVRDLLKKAAKKKAPKREKPRRTKPKKVSRVKPKTTRKAKPVKGKAKPKAKPKKA